MKYLVIEIQTNSDGTVGNLISSYDNRNEAERQYYLILAAAAISQLPIHTAVLLTNDGRLLEHHAYKRVEDEED